MNNSYVPPHMRNIDINNEILNAIPDSTSFPTLLKEEIKIINKFTETSFAEQASRWKTFEDSSMRQSIREERNKVDDAFIQSQNPFKNFKKRQAFTKTVVEAKPIVVSAPAEEEWTVVDNKKYKKKKPEKVYTEADFLEESSTEEKEQQEEEDTYWRNS